MATRDIHSNVKVVQTLKAAAVTTTQTSTGIDSRGFDSVEHLIVIGEMTNVGGSPPPA